ncbi:MAG TPA: glycoside hydrolase family 2 TIM barrel-domain containing protein, partial [bacterium]|nr:glycoside hydrolase family 2 TIM barrel-domain containing protein [bacterium]
MPFSENRYPITRWHWKPAGKKKPTDSPGVLKSLVSSTGWKTASPRQGVYGEKPGRAWFRVALPEFPGPGRFVHFTSVGDDCVVYLNGKKLLEHERWIDAFDVSLDSAWKEGGPNHLVLLVENTYGPVYIGEADLETAAASPQGPALQDFDDRKWRLLNLPHDFVVEGKFNPKGNDYNGYLIPGIGWYRKELDIPASDRGRRLWLDFDGVFRNSRVWLNGRFLGRHNSGYTPCRYDLTGLVRHGGRNILSVRVDARGAEGWWYEGGGIYRHVWLTKAEPIHVAPWGVYVVSKPVGKGALVNIETTLRSAKPESGKLRLINEIKDPKGRLVLKLASVFTPGANGEKILRQNGSLKRARLWNLENPHLYKATTRIERGGRELDRVETTFGIRSIRFDKDKGFFLNGKPVKLKGTCNHQDHAGLGVALPARLFSYRLEKLKAMGSNAYRCAHHPHATELLDACDRMGMLVVDENRRLGDSPEVLEQVKAMVLRDRNHPSVILWSMCNEEPKQGTPEGYRRGFTIKKTILRHDRTRPITAAVNHSFEGGIRRLVDVEGINYNINQYEDFRKNHPQTPFFGSETASTLCSRGIYKTDPKRGYVSAYDVNHTLWSLPA